MPIEVPDLPSTSGATMYRTANASEVLETLYGEVCATRDSDLAVFRPRHQPWIEESSVFNLMKVKRSCPRSVSYTHLTLPTILRV